MSYDIQNTAVRNSILAFTAELKTRLESSVNAETAQYAENAGKLEGLSLNEVVELIAGTTGLTIQDVQTSLDEFIARRDNPHQVTAAQVGLDLVDNFATATDAEAAGSGFAYTATADQTVFVGADDVSAVLELQDTAVVYVELNGNRLAEADYTVDILNDTVTLVNPSLAGDKVVIRAVTVDRFLTPTVLWNVLDVFWAQKVGGAPATLDTIAELALALENNPDVIDNLTTLIGSKATQADIDTSIAALTKASVGLDLVENFGVATTQEAIDGLATDKYVTPALVKAHVDAAAQNLQSNIDAKATQADIDAAIAALTKANVGLDLVDNYATATNAQALAGTATNLFMTPAANKHVRTDIESDVTASLVALETAFNDALTNLTAV